MLIVHNFKLDFNTSTKIYKVISKEISICPVCGEVLCLYGCRTRIMINEEGEQSYLEIQRLYCETCHRIHHELPSILIPYKRYTQKAIQEVIDGYLQDTQDTITVVADEKTIYNWISWFFTLSTYFQNCLTTIEERLTVTHLTKSLLPFQRNDKPSIWLAELVRSIVNSNLWLSTRSYLHVQPVDVKINM